MCYPAELMRRRLYKIVQKIGMKPGKVPIIISKYYNLSNNYFLGKCLLAAYRGKQQQASGYIFNSLYLKKNQIHSLTLKLVVSKMRSFEIEF